MTNQSTYRNNSDVATLCDIVKRLLTENKQTECEEIIQAAMAKFPHSAIPHNLIGVLLERSGKHTEAMCHFRAALALEPSFGAAQRNLEYFGCTRKVGKYFLDDRDLDLNLRAS